MKDEGPEGTLSPGDHTALWSRARLRPDAGPQTGHQPIPGILSRASSERPSAQLGLCQANPWASPKTHPSPLKPGALIPPLPGLWVCRLQRTFLTGDGKQPCTSSLSDRIRGAGRPPTSSLPSRHSHLLVVRGYWW